MKKFCSKLNFLIIFVLFSHLPAFGQMITYGGCTDFRGIPVVSISIPSLNDVAKANLDQWGRPVIYYNPNVLNWLSPASRLFWYAHECAHHKLAHIARMGTTYPVLLEQEADCWGIRTIYYNRMISDNDVYIIQQEISRSPGDWSHFPGPRRAINLIACLNSPRGR